MRKNFWFFAGVALSAVCVGEIPIQAQIQARPRLSYGEVLHSTLKRKIADLYVRRNTALQEFTHNSPEVRAIEAQIRAARRQLQSQSQAPRHLPPGDPKWRPKAQLLSCSLR